MRTRSRRCDESGTTTLFIVGFAVVLMMLVAVVVDASAAYLQRQSLASLADGAALAAADGGAQGAGVYDGGLGAGGRLGLDTATAEVIAADHLDRSGAGRRFPGLRVEVAVRGDRVVVRLRAPLELPLTFPGMAEAASVGATGSAVVQRLD